MAEYINRAYALEVIRHISEDEPWQETCVNNVTRLLDELPSIDIVHCKDCIHNGSVDTDCPFRWKDEKFNMPSPDDYCSYGERK